MERNGYKYQDAGERLKKLIETMDDGDKLPNSDGSPAAQIAGR